MNKRTSYTTKRNIRLAASATVCVAMSFVFAAAAYAGFLGNSGLLPVCADSKYRPEAIIFLIFNVVKFLWGFTGTVALVMLVVGGFSMLLAGGDPQKVKSGITTIRNAIIGIVIVLGSWLIINTLVGFVTTGQMPTGVANIFSSGWADSVDPCYD